MRESDEAGRVRPPRHERALAACTMLGIIGVFGVVLHVGGWAGQIMQGMVFVAIIACGLIGFGKDDNA